MLSQARPWRSMRFLLLGAVLVSLFFFFTGQQRHYHAFSNNDRVSPIANGTLGFGQIFVLGMAERSDKRDAMELAASLTGLKIEWVDGVSGASMHDKAIPPAHTDMSEKEFHMDGELGCWRGHMNVLRRIVKEGLASALVLEDDSDWDVHIVEQMQKFAQSSQDVLSQTRPRYTGLEGSPYGDGWDILWLGHCGGWAPGEQYSDYYSVIQGDNTVPPSFDIKDLTNGLGDNNVTCAVHENRDPPERKCPRPNLAADERIVQFKGSPICTFGYAVSLQGARKMFARLGALSLTDVAANVDTEMTELCRGDNDVGREPTMCLTVSPPYFMTHRPKGPVNSESDIHDGADQMRSQGETVGVKWSTRLNAENIIAGVELESQYIQSPDKQWRYKVPAEYRSHKADNK